MTLHDDLMSTHPDLREIGTRLEPPPPPAPRPGRRRAAFAVGAVAALAVGAATWWMFDSRVPAGDYDDVVAELETARSDLTAAETAAAQEQAARSSEVSSLNEEISALREDNARLQDQLAYSTARVDELTGTTDELRGRLDTAGSLATILAYNELSMSPELLAELRASGVDLAPYDELLARLGHDTTLDAWVASGEGWFRLNGAVQASRDDQLIDAWLRFNDAEVGSLEEAIALNQYYLRLETMLYDSTATPDVTDDGIQAAVVGA